MARRRRVGAAWAAGVVLPVGVVLSALLLAGCAPLFRSHDFAANGLTRYDDRLRRLASEGRADSALALAAPERAEVGDELLRLQYEGLLAHYAGRWEESNAALQAAATLAEERYTRSLSRAALSLLTSDNVLPYRPPGTERLLLHYYGALNYLRAGDEESAAVEARRLSHLLNLEADDGLERPERRTLHATLRYMAGATFEAAGERNDAEVAYRLARRLAAEAVPDGQAAEMAPGHGAEAGGGEEGSPPELALPPPDSGDVVVIVERGFAPYRVSRSQAVLLWPDEVRALSAGAASEAEGSRGSPLEAAAAVAARLVAEKAAGRDLAERGEPGATDPPERGRSGRKRSGPSAAADPPPPIPLEGPLRDAIRTARERGDAEAPARARRAARRTGTPYLLLVAWPDLALPPSLPPPRLRAPGDVSRPVGLRSDLAGVLAADFAEQQPLLLAKSLLRGLAKYAVAKTVKDELKEEDEVLGEVAGLVANAGLSLLERADVRCWHLLPADLSVVRLRLPAGSSDLAVELPSRDFRPGRAMEVGPVEVRPGGVTVVSVRAWR